MKNHLIAVSLMFTSLVFSPGLKGFTSPVEKKIDSLITENFSTEGPGGVILIIQNNIVTHQKHFGMADAENAVPITPSTTFNLASVAKLFTGYAILLLEQQGKLKVDDPVHKYVKNLPQYDHPVTIRQLAHHSSGIASTDVLRLVANMDLAGEWNQQQELKLIRDYNQLNFKPGDEYLYSNGGYSLLAEVIENASGMSYSEYIQKNIFAPLGMTNAFVLDKKDKLTKTVALGHQLKNGQQETIKSPGDLSYGGSNICVSASDMIALSNFFIKNGGDKKHIANRLLNKSFITNHGDTIDYSWGMSVSNYKGLKMVWHSGGDLGFRARFLIFPEQQTVIFAAFNSENVRDRQIVMAIADWMLGEYFKVVPAKERATVEVEKSTLQNYKGLFRMPAGQMMEIGLENEELVISFPGSPKFKLYPESQNHFFIKDFDAQVSFHPETNKTVNNITWHQSGMKVRASRISPPRMPEPVELVDFAGVYNHPGLKVDYTVEYADGSLTLITPETFKTYLNIENLQLTPAGDDYFIAGRLGFARFTRDSSGKVNQMIITDIGRLRNITFNKK